MMTLKALMVLAVLTFTKGQPQIGQNSRHFKYSINPTNIRERLKILPAPVPGFDLLRWVGHWYFQYHKAPCSWTISEEFTDFTQVAELHGNNVLWHETMRNQGLCNSVTSPVYIRGPGVFTGKDVVGDNWSGKIIVASTDYIGYSITQGCTKFSVLDDTCEDGWLYVKTRDIRPHPEVLRRIEIALQKIWGISINQLTRITHERPCSYGGKVIG